MRPPIIVGQCFGLSDNDELGSRSLREPPDGDAALRTEATRDSAGSSGCELTPRQLDDVAGITRR